MIFIYVFLFGVNLVFAETTKEPPTDSVRKPFINMLQQIVKVNRDRMDTLQRLLQLEDIVLTKSDLRYLNNEETDASSEDEARQDAIMTILDYLHEKRNIRRAQSDKEDEDIINILLLPLITRSKTGKIPIDQTSTENVPKEPKTLGHIDENSETDDGKIPIDETSAEDNQENLEDQQQIYNQENLMLGQTSKNSDTDDKKIPIDQTSADYDQENPKDLYQKLAENQVNLKYLHLKLSDNQENLNQQKAHSIIKEMRNEIRNTKRPTEINAEVKDIPEVLLKKFNQELDKAEKDPKLIMNSELHKVEEENDPILLNSEVTEALRKSWMKTVKKKGSKTCIRACKATHKSFCRLFSCSRRAKRTFKKECKLNCKAKFRGQYDDE